MQKLKPENFLEVSIKNIENQNPLKKIKPNPIHLKKQGLTLELKKNPNHHPKLLIDHNSLLSKKSSHFRQTQSSLMNPNSNSESKVIKLNSNETSLIPSLFVPEEIDTSEISNIKKDNIQEEEEEKNIPMEQQPRSAFTRKSSHKSHTESKNISPRQKKRSIDFSFQQENELLEMPENLEYYEIPNMYKERTENLKKSNLFYPNKDSFYLLKMPFNIIKEESLPYDMSNELSHYLSSLSLSDQYIIEGNRILSGLNLNQNPNSSISISKIITDSFQNANTPKMITESFNRSNTKHHTFTITNSSEKSSKILENNSFIKTSNALEDHLNYNNRRTSMSYFKNPNLINNNNNDLINRANPIQKCLHQKILTCESISSNCQMASLMNNNDESINSNFQNNDNGNNFNRKITCLPSTESILSLRAVNTNVDMIGELSNNYLKSEIEDFSAQEFLNMGK